MYNCVKHCIDPSLSPTLKTVLTNDTFANVHHLFLKPKLEKILGFCGILFKNMMNVVAY